MKRTLRCLLIVLMLAWAATRAWTADPTARQAAPSPPAGTSVSELDDHPAPAIQPLPPLAIQPPEQRPCGLWEYLVELHNAYVYRTDTLDLSPRPPPVHGLHVFADAGFYFLQPYFSSNPSSTFHGTGSLNGATTTTTGTNEFDYDPGFEPRVEVGIVCASGLGFRADWWHFDQVARSRPIPDEDKTGKSGISSAPVDGVPGFTSPSATALKFGLFKEVLAFDSHLRLDVLDWEAIQEWRPEGWDILLSGGLRYAYLSQSYEASRFNNGTGKSGKTKVLVAVDADLLDDGHSFSGLGPTVSMDAVRPIGTLGFALYGTARSSLLFGRGRFQAFQNSRVAVVPSGGSSTKPLVFTNLLFQNVGTERSDVLPIEEVEVGGQWAHNFGRFGVFARVGLVGQVWIDAGNSTSESGDLGFFGLTVTGGLEY